MNRISVWIVIVFACSTLPGCTPSALIQKDRVDFNFQDEGFLSPKVLQTVGKARVAGSEIRADEYCADQALAHAKRKALSAIIHTRFDLPSRKKSISLQPGSAFTDDYPFPLTERDYARGLIDFDALIGSGYIALQDTRQAESCTVVFRIRSEDLPAAIRRIQVTFRPEKWDK